MKHVTIQHFTLNLFSATQYLYLVKLSKENLHAEWRKNNDMSALKCALARMWIHSSITLLRNRIWWLAHVMGCTFWYICAGPDAFPWFSRGLGGQGWVKVRWITLLYVNMSCISFLCQRGGGARGTERQTEGPVEEVCPALLQGTHSLHTALHPWGDCLIFAAYHYDIGCLGCALKDAS